MTGFHKILVPIDFSAHSDEAMRIAVDLAKRYSAAITLVNVYQPIDLTLPEGAWIITPDQERVILAAFKERLGRAEKQLADLGAAGIESHVLQGVIAPEIVGYARENQIALIVMGTQGRTGLRHFLLGSVAEHVLRTAPCPVLVVKAVENAAKQEAV